MSGERLALDLDVESKAVLDAARATGHAAKALVKEGPLRIVILGFTPQSSLDEHRTAGPIAIQAVSGSVTVSAQGKDHVLDAGSCCCWTPL